METNINEKEITIKKEIWNQRKKWFYIITGIIFLIIFIVWLKSKNKIIMPPNAIWLLIILSIIGAIIGALYYYDKNYRKNRNAIDDALKAIEETYKKLGLIYNPLDIELDYYETGEILVQANNTHYGKKTFVIKDGTIKAITNTELWQKIKENRTQEKFIDILRRQEREKKELLERID